jgi:hypothetical protein
MQKAECSKLLRSHARPSGAWTIWYVVYACMCTCNSETSDDFVDFGPKNKQSVAHFLALSLHVSLAKLAAKVIGMLSDHSCQAALGLVALDGKSQAQRSRALESSISKFDSCQCFLITDAGPVC